MTDQLALLVADIYETAGLLRRAGEFIAAQESQTQARWQLLSAVSEQALTVPQAARRLGITRQGVQRVANELIAEGLAEFAGNPDHRNSPLLSLTTTGRQTMQRIAKRAERFHGKIAQKLTNPEIVRTRDVLRTLILELRAAAQSADV
jgi:DNA-binding MarR family transcriptional regulator